MTKKFWLAVAAYVLPTFPLGYFWHLSTFKANYDALQLYRPDVIIPMGLASMLIQGAILAWAYPKLFSTARRDWLASAAKFFGTLGVLAWSLIVLPVAAKFGMTSVANFMTLETGFEALQFLVVSPLIALAWRDDA
jgi:cytochrome c oxidase subunit IV